MVHASKFTSRIPRYPPNPDEDDSLDHYEKEDMKKRNEEFPEEILFRLEDLEAFYAKYAEHDQRIKDFVERLADMVRT